MKTVRLHHETQRGGEITVQGPPVPLGETAAFPVDENGDFEAPEAMAGGLLRILGPVVTKAPARAKRKEADA